MGKTSHSLVVLPNNEDSLVGFSIVSGSCSWTSSDQSWSFYDGYYRWWDMGISSLFGNYAFERVPLSIVLVFTFQKQTNSKRTILVIAILDRIRFDNELIWWGLYFFPMKIKWNLDGSRCFVLSSCMVILPCVSLSLAFFSAASAMIPYDYFRSFFIFFFYVFLIILRSFIPCKSRLLSCLS